MSETVRTERRPTRQPVSLRKALYAPEMPGYKTRWVNDVEGRIDMFKAGGWTPVEKSEGVEYANKQKLAGTPVGSLNSVSVGGGVKAVLMKIKEEFYNEDQAAKAEAIDSAERTMTKGVSIEGQYGSIDVKR
jgi:hypothetical protein